MKLSELLQGLEPLAVHADPEQEITGVYYDSRQVTPGSVFVAISGFAVDGHKFIPMAREKGAAVVLCERVPEGEGEYVLLSDTRWALALVGANWFGHPADSMTMIGITGTNGKTSVTVILKDVLEKTVGAKVGLIGTIQNMIGDEILPTERTTPESCEVQALFRKMLDAGCTHVIMEVSSHALVLHRVGGVRFRSGLFTNLTQDHLDFHKTMEEYRKAKSLLFSVCDKGVINADDEAAAKMLEEAKCPVVTFSAGKNPAALTAEDIRLEASHVAFRASCGGETVEMELGIPGAFSVYNALGVTGLALSLGLTLPQIADAMASAQGVKGRGLHQLPGYFLRRPYCRADQGGYGQARGRRSALLL